LAVVYLMCAPNGGSARSYLTLSTLATVLQTQDNHPHHRLAMPLQHGSLSLRWERWPVRSDVMRMTSELDRGESI